MSLKTEFLDGINGFTQKMMAVFTAGQELVVNNNSLLVSGLQQNAAKGLQTFTVNIPVLFETENLRLKSTHMQTFFSGIKHQLMSEDIYDYEFKVSLNTSDQIVTSVDIEFNL